MENDSSVDERHVRIDTSYQQTQGVRTQPGHICSGSHTNDLARSDESNDHEAWDTNAGETRLTEQVNDLTMQSSSGNEGTIFSTLRDEKSPNAAGPTRVNNGTKSGNLKRNAKQTKHDLDANVKQTTDHESVENTQQQVQQRLIEAFEAEIQTNGSHNVPYEVMSVPNMESKDKMEHPLFAFSAKADPDTMYLHEAMRQPDRKEFIQAMDKELKDQLEHGNFTVVHKSTVPEGATVLPTVWAMRRKRKQDTGEIHKCKGRLNVDGSNQQRGINFWETFAPVATWASIRFILVLTLIHNWKTRQIDYVQAYTQADAPLDNLYVKVPRGVEVEDGKREDYVMKVNKNVYGTHQAGRVWNKHLVDKLKSIGFSQSQIDECVFYRKRCIYVLYTDDSILVGPDNNELDAIVNDMKRIGLKLTIEGSIDDFLGVNIERRDDGTFNLTQPHLIDTILKEMRLHSDNVSVKTTPAAVSAILKRDSDGIAFDGHFNYKSIIGKLNFLEKNTRPDISHAVHQAARFSADPKQSHGKAVNCTVSQGRIKKHNHSALHCKNWKAQLEVPREDARLKSRLSGLRGLIGTNVAGDIPRHYKTPSHKLRSFVQDGASNSFQH